MIFIKIMNLCLYLGARFSKDKNLERKSKILQNGERKIRNFNR